MGRLVRAGRNKDIRELIRRERKPALVLERGELHRMIQGDLKKSRRSIAQLVYQGEIVVYYGVED